MKRAIVLQHVPFEGPARLAEPLLARGYTLDVHALYAGAPVPDRLADDEVLVVMGGPMGVADVDGPEHPFLRREVTLLERCIRDDAPVLGVCLGAQLLAFAGGARVGPLQSADGRRAYELGWGELAFHHAEDHGVLRGLPATAPVLSWHGDTFAIPSGGRLLASTAACRHQGFQLGSRLFGLQFHCELGAEDVEELLREDAGFVAKVLGPGGADAIRRDTQAMQAASRAIGRRLLDNVFEAMEGGPAAASR
jgi:GMP synthase-like glutamine amidotransferase